MKCLASVLLVALFLGQLSAAETKLAPGTWRGTAIVTIVVDAAGNQTVTVDPAMPLTITGGGGGPVVPPGEPSVGLGAAAAKLTKETINAGGSATTAAGISSAYSMVGDSVSEGKTQPELALSGVKFLLDGLLATQPDKDKWAAFRTALGKEFDTVRQDGLLKTKEQYAKAFKDVSAGINSVIGFNGSLTAPAQELNANPGFLDKIDIAKLMELIKFLFELWKLFSAAQVSYVITVNSVMS